MIIGDLMRENPIPADLEAALLRSAALIPGIELIESERDVAGRTGVGVAVDYRGYSDILIFNRDSYELLGETLAPQREARQADSACDPVRRGCVRMTAKP